MSAGQADVLSAAPRPYPGLVNNVPRPQATLLPAAAPELTRRRAPASRHIPTVVRPHIFMTRIELLEPTQTLARAQPLARPKHRLLHALRTPALVVAVLLAGIFIQTAAFGEVAIAAYAVFALWKRQPARTSFMLALLLLVAVVVLLLIKTNDNLAATFTIYAFLLLGVGALSSLREKEVQGE